jgi:hypothetical protein
MKETIYDVYGDRGSRSGGLAAHPRQAINLVHYPYASAVDLFYVKRDRYQSKCYSSSKPPQRIFFSGSGRISITC